MTYSKIYCMFFDSNKAYGMDDLQADEEAKKQTRDYCNVLRRIDESLAPPRTPAVLVEEEIRTGMIEGWIRRIDES